MTKQDKSTQVTLKRYDRIAPFYDLMDKLAEGFRYHKWRELLWSKIEGSKILEVGVGTGKNFPYYPSGAEVVAIDFSEKMLARARSRAQRDGVRVELQHMDVQELQFGDDTFDTVADTFVFCSVPDPILGLREIGRVCKPGGKVVMLEHVLSASRLVSLVMNAINPMVVRMMGANINRRTAENVSQSGLTVEQVTDLGLGIFKLIEARKLRKG